MKGSAEIWEANGQPWNRPNHQYGATSRDFRTRHDPDGSHVHEPHMDIEGYEGWGIGPSPRAAIHKPDFVEKHQPKKLDPSARQRANRIHRVTPRKVVIRV